MRVRSGLRWSVASQVAVRILTMASTVVLLRLVAPADYGTFVFGLAVVTVVMAINDVGQSVAVSRWPGAELPLAARCGTTIAWAASGLAFAACLAAAGPLARLAGAPEAAGLIRLMSLLLVVDGLTAVPRALLLRDFRQRRVALGELVAVVVNVAATLGLALAGVDAWAPACGTVAAAALSAAIVLASAGHVPLPGWDRRVIGEALRFGSPWAATLLVELLLLNVDYVVVGNQLGTSALGLYAVAFNVSSWPATLFTQAIRRVSVAGFAHLQERGDELAAAFARSVTVLATVLVPLCVGLAVIAEPLLRILYGAPFAAVGPALSWLVVLAGARVAAGLVVDLLLAQGRSRATVVVHLLWLAATVPALLVAARIGGLAGVAVAHAAIGLAVVVPIHVVALRQLAVTGGVLLRPLVRPLVAGAVALALGFGTVRVTAGPWVELLVAGPVVAATYLALAVTPAQLRALGSWRTTPVSP